MNNRLKKECRRKEKAIKEKDEVISVRKQKVFDQESALKKSMNDLSSLKERSCMVETQLDLCHRSNVTLMVSMNNAINSM